MENAPQLPPPQSSLLMCPFLLMSPLNVVFLEEVIKNVHENQQAKYEQVKIKLSTLKRS